MYYELIILNVSLCDGSPELFIYLLHIYIRISTEAFDYRKRNVRRENASRDIKKHFKCE